jgi:transcriptional regulator with XRE-family HTH domain
MKFEKMDFNVLVGNNISYYRRLKNLSQEELASKADIDRTYMSSIERGKRNISLLVAIKISKALDINLNNLLENNNEIDINGDNFRRGS